MTEIHEAGILVADDDELLLSALSRVLRRTRRPVFTATGAGDATARLAEQPIGVIICEPHVPELAAFLVEARTLRPNAARIILTGYPEFSGVVRAINDAAPFKMLTKPWLDDELLAMVALAFEIYAINCRRDTLIDEYAAIRSRAERQHAARLLAALAESLRPQISRTAIDALPVGAVVLDGGRVTQANPAAVQLLARHELPAPAAGATLDELPPALAALLSAALAAPRRERCDYRLGDGRRLDIIAADTDGGTLLAFAACSEEGSDA